MKSFHRVSTTHLRKAWRIGVDGERRMEDLTRRAAPWDFSISCCGLAPTELFATPKLCFSPSQLSLPRSAYWQVCHYSCTRWVELSAWPPSSFKKIQYELDVSAATFPQPRHHVKEPEARLRYVAPCSSVGPFSFLFQRQRSRRFFRSFAVNMEIVPAA